MPQIHDKINLQDLIDALRGRRWAFHQCNAGLCLTKADPNPKNVFKTTGKRRRLLMREISKEHLDEILVYSRNLQEAVAQVEAISTGLQLAPEFAHKSAAAPAIDMDRMEKLMAQRVENEVSKALERSESKQAEEIERLREELEKAKQEAKKPAAKRKSRKQPKNGVVERLKQQSDEPELDEEGQKALDAALSAGNAE